MRLLCFLWLLLFLIRKKDNHKRRKRHKMKEEFQCLKCGNCCRPRGYVRLQENEAELIAGYQGMEVLQFVKECTRLTADRTCLSLNERDDGTCIFLTEDSTCMINDVKPQQCRDFPETWSYAGAEKLCPVLARMNESGALSGNTEEERERKI
jgi:uncharacterized protein